MQTNLINKKVQFIKYNEKVLGTIVGLDGYVTYDKHYHVSVIILDDAGKLNVSNIEYVTIVNE